MSFLTKAFWKTIWSDWRYAFIAVAIILVLLYGVYSWFQMKRSWNWQVGGYKARAHEMVCEMARDGVLQKGPNWAKECD